MRMTHGTWTRRFHDLLETLLFLAAAAFAWHLWPAFLPPDKPPATPDSPSPPFLAFLGDTEISGFLRSYATMAPATGTRPSPFTRLESLLEAERPDSVSIFPRATDQSVPLPVPRLAFLPPPPTPAGKQDADAPPPAAAFWELDAPGTITLDAEQLRNISEQIVDSGEFSAIVYFDADGFADFAVFPPGQTSIPADSRSEIDRTLLLSRSSSGAPARISWRWRR